MRAVFPHRSQRPGRLTNRTACRTCCPTASDFVVSPGAVPGVYAFDPATKDIKLVMKSESEAFFVEPGHLAFVRDSNLMIQPFDPRRLELSGAQPIAAGVHSSYQRQIVNMSIGAQGTLVYQPLTRSFVSLGVVSREGALAHRDRAGWHAAGVHIRHPPRTDDAPWSDWSASQIKRSLAMLDLEPRHGHADRRRHVVSRALPHLAWGRRASCAPRQVVLATKS